jgi:hypothetical protein
MTIRRIADVALAAGILHAFRAGREKAPKAIPVSVEIPATRAGSERDHGWQWDLLQAEYVSLREESSQARQAQQSTISWSLAAFATIFAGGLVFVSSFFKDGANASVPVMVFYVLIFGVALPGFAFAACLAYMGELIRLERVGVYLRGLEKYLANSTAPGSPLNGGPLRWETYLRQKSPEVAISRGKKRQIGNIGGIGVYVGAEIVSAIAFVVGSLTHKFENDNNLWHLGSIAWVVLLLFVFFYTLFAVGVSLVRAGQEAQVYEEVRPAGGPI